MMPREVYGMIAKGSMPGGLRCAARNSKHSWAKVRPWRGNGRVVGTVISEA